MNLVGTHP